MRIFSFNEPLNFMRFKMPALMLSIVLLLSSFGLLFTKGINWGLDFTGGTVIEVGYTQNADLTQVRAILAERGYADAVVQYFGSSQDVAIRIAPREGVEQSRISNEIMAALSETSATPIEMRRIEFVGPSVGDELKEQGGLAMLTALIGILLYVGMRFEWRLSLGAVLALGHDVIITLGLFSLLQLEFDLTVLAAILALIGYSINDTIVVFDRIRESFRKLRDSTPEETVNDAVTSTLNRTVVTSLTTIIVLIVLFYMGGALIHNFATALLFGIAIGTYSSIFVASGIAVQLGLNRDDMLPPPPPEKEGEGTEPLM
ncbi:protein translocase subunit SecF [Alishewanella sp. 16-MA]|uniref:Protein-export membrane protein SecF n=1 Tax=Alishewanella maricola TaxID=2795740 RepID=A0ABS8BZY8_9ALTE|nr:protein translocase subunit SecF [Alishewanella sp. SMS8]MCB5225380.1 protein translocase subunit SecF [Alishewanella maricola]MDP4945039.1 protein translocase subunit SecF [Alishewanella sp.]MDP5036836.1 protein translocase subunit SecF [Alishewanella sp.]MDP5187577.1 protein translocase subunit SecF [Alishewanella sp.]MDP5458728.1 protein translocase subunit SecF [Alishewanella sp. SMS8]